MVLHRVVLHSVTDEPVSVLAAVLGLANVNEIVLKENVNVRHVGRLATENVALGPVKLTALELEVDKNAAELIGSGLEESAELTDIHGSVEVEVVLKRGGSDAVGNVSHKNLGVVRNGGTVKNRVLKVRNARRNKLGRSKNEELLENRESVDATALHLRELLAVLLTKTGVDDLIKLGGVQSHADGQKGVHLVRLLRHSVELSRSVDVLCSRNEEQDV